MADLYGWHWQDYPETNSTNDLAAKLSANPPAQRFVVTAERQTQGRGRRGREWQSLTGNLFMSLAMEEPSPNWSELVFVVSLALLETVRVYQPEINVRLKWPNDVLVKGRKISGILLEKGAGLYIIIGIGVNIAAAPLSTESLYPAASLAESGINTDRCAFLAAFLQQFNRFYELWIKSGFAAVKEQWLKKALGLNREISVNLPRQSLDGIFRGIDDNGCLLLETAGKITKIAAGDVFFQKD